MMEICAICSLNRPPLLPMSVEHRQLLEAVVSPILRNVDLEAYHLLLCMECQGKMLSVQQFQMVALNGVRNLKYLLRKENSESTTVQNNGGCKDPVLVADMEPEIIKPEPTPDESDPLQEFHHKPEPLPECEPDFDPQPVFECQLDPHSDVAQKELVPQPGTMSQFQRDSVYAMDCDASFEPNIGQSENPTDTFVEANVDTKSRNVDTPTSAENDLSKKSHIRKHSYRRKILKKSQHGSCTNCSKKGLRSIGIRKKKHAEDDIIKCDECSKHRNVEALLHTQHKRTSIKMDTSKRKKKYTDTQLQTALTAVKDGMSITEASQKYNIPKATIHDKVNKKYPEGATPGARTVLSKDEERQLVTWILDLSDAGFTITKRNLFSEVKNLLAKLQRENPFKNGTPGRHWYEGFLARNPEVSIKVLQNTATDDVTGESIQAWFGRVEAHLKKEHIEDIFNDPRRIFNCESVFYEKHDDNVVVKKYSNTVYRTAEKEFLAVMLTVSADGNFHPPLIVFPKSASIIDMPPEWCIAQSDSGRVTEEIICKQIINVFYPRLIENNIPLPVVLFINGLSYINLSLFVFCRDKGIILIALLPDIQPLDIAVFRPLKYKCNELKQTKLRKEVFVKDLDVCIKNAALNGAIVDSFRSCGLYPCDINNIDYSKFIK